MRTLLTTKGRNGGAERDEIGRCLAAAAEQGFWLDIEAPDEDDYRLLAEVFRFHALSIEDVRHRDQRPKIEEYADYDFLVIFQASGTPDEVALLEHHLFVGRTYLVTAHLEPSPPLDALKDRIARSPELTKGQPGFLTYLVMDALVDATFPIIEAIDDTVDLLEDDITEAASPASLDRIYHLKHSVTELRRFLGAQRDVFQRLITHTIHVQHPELTFYHRDVYDHIVRQYEEIDSLRDLLTSAMDVYLSTVSNRINQTMKTLTAIASLFLPLSFLAGFYGMNFGFLVSGLEATPAAFYAGVGTMVIATVIQLYLFRRRGWI